MVLGDFYEGILPSGVGYSVSEMVTQDQSNLVKRVKKGSIYAYEDLLFDRLESLGDLQRGAFTKEYVRNMLNEDLKFALLKMRNFSFEDETDFTFSVEFPLDKGEKEKITETKTVDLSTFKVKPYKWVRDRMAEMQEEDESLEFKNHEFPEIYSSYEDMLTANLEQEFVVKNKTIKYKLMSGKAKKQRTTRFKDVDDYMAALYIREPKMLNKDLDVWQQVQWSKGVPASVGDKFQRSFFDVEGKVDTSATIRSDKNPMKTIMIDFLSVGEFFSPSLGV